MRGQLCGRAQDYHRFTEFLVDGEIIIVGL